MKNITRKLICLTIPFLVLGCAPAGAQSSDNGDASSNSVAASSKNSGKSSKSSSSKQPSSSGPHEHVWATTWSYDDTSHWHACTVKGCTEKKDVTTHTWGNYVSMDPSKLSGAEKYAYSNPKVKKCRDCDAYDHSSISGTNILPEIRFTFDKNDPDANFATKAKKDDVTRPEVQGKITLTNCDSKYQLKDVAAGMKVRGNQTAGWSKKAFRLKFSSKQNLLGLNKGQKFKKWVLLADAKDTCLVRTALGLYVSKAVVKEGDNVWVSDFTPVTIYLNDEYWGFYYLADQKEVKPGRVNLPEPEDADGNLITTTDIGYCFELDYYATDERKKGAEADATFEVTYSPQMVTGNVQGALPPGGIKTYTLLSDINDGPANAATTDKNSQQVAFIKKKVESLYTVLYNAAVNKKAYEINEAGNAVQTNNKTVRQVMEEYFNLESWADGIIINAFSCPPDLGYSSFYMAYDNSPTGDKKLRFDVPWDFDSNFGNRNNFLVNANEHVYVDRTHNMWLQLLYKLDFFVNDYVKVKWNTIRDEQAFEGMFHMMREHFAANDAEIHRNHYKWPQNDAAHQPPNNFDEIREPYKDPAKYLQAEEETINWCAKRVNYLEKQWGNNRGNVNTNA